jgi:hypothetical protein
MFLMSSQVKNPVSANYETKNTSIFLLLLLLLLFRMLVNRLYTQTKTNSKQRYTMQQLKKRLCTRYGKRSIKPLKCR